MEKWAEEAELSGCPVMGAKDKSVLGKNLHLPECIPIDYMHAVLGGVFKSLDKKLV